jgi:hypothetical protein
MEWIQTYTGKKHLIEDPEASDLCIKDIAHALSQICRFGGHSKQFYSVAQHSILVSDNVSGSNKLCGLLHDAAEAYTGDMLKPFKILLGDGIFRDVEMYTELAIAKKYDLPWPLPEEVKAVDERMLMTEARDVMGGQRGKWLSDAMPFDRRITCWPSLLAEELFLDRYRELTEIQETDDV